MNVLITGGNRGLGLELVLQAAKRGHHVLTTVRDKQGATQLAQALDSHAIPNNKVTVFQADVRDEASIAAIAEQVRQSGVMLDSIINNAAVLLGRNADIESLDLKEVELSFDINLFGPIRVVKHFLSLLRDQNGTVINISSEAGSLQGAYGGDYPYALSKAALNMFSMQLKQLLAKRGINVWSIHPGWMRTDMGGTNAPLSPNESAVAIIDIMERKVAVKSDLVFIDYSGKAMPL